MSSDLAALRGTVQTLSSHELPASYRLDKENDPNGTAPDDANDANSHGDGKSTGVYDPALLRRYKDLREAYIHQRTMEQFVQALGEYDPDTNTLPLPEPVTEEAKEALKTRRQEVMASVNRTVAAVGSGVDEVRNNWEQFVEKREELAQIVEQMERAERQRQLDGEGDEDDAMDDEGGEITEEDVALEKERLEEVRQRRAALEERLRGVRAQIVDVEDECERTKRAVNEVRARSGRKKLDWRGGNGGHGASGKEGDGTNNDVEHISTVAREAESEIAALQGRAAGLKESQEFYDGIRELMEELGGVKILSSKSVPSDDEGEGFVLTLMLWGSHILEMALAKSSSDKDGLRVESAKLTTPTAFPLPEASSQDEQTASQAENTMHSISLSNASFSKIMAQKPAQSMEIPPLDDLVAWGQTRESSSAGMRFVIVETMARLRTLEARVHELATLRERYAAQVYEAPHAGAEQEVVCTLNEGVAVAFRLGADCPLLPGSLYVSEMSGTGGWPDDKLEELKEALAGRRCKGPVEAMEFIVGEIRRWSKEEGWTVPGTPSLPRGNR